MTTLTRWVLRHKRLVTALWVVIAIAAFGAVGPAGDALSEEFSLPGRESYETNLDIAALYGNGGDVAPIVPVVTLPPGTTVDTPGVERELDAALARVQTALPDARIASYGSTGDDAFVSADRRTTFALAYIPHRPGLEPGQAEARRAQDALAGVTVGGAAVDITGVEALRAAGAATEGAGDTSVTLLLEVLLAGLGSLIVLAFVFGSFMALVPLLMAAVAVPDHVPADLAAHRGHRRQRRRPVPGRARRARHRDRLRAAHRHALARGAARRRDQRGRRGERDGARRLAPSSSAGRPSRSRCSRSSSCRSRSCAASASPACSSRWSAWRSRSRCCRSCSPRSGRGWTGRAAGPSAAAAACGPRGRGWSCAAAGSPRSRRRRRCWRWSACASTIQLGDPRAESLAQTGPARAGFEKLATPGSAPAR